MASCYHHLMIFECPFRAGREQQAGRGCHAGRESSSCGSPQQQHREQPGMQCNGTFIGVARVFVQRSRRD